MFLFISGAVKLSFSGTFLILRSNFSDYKNWLVFCVLGNFWRAFGLNLIQPKKGA